ncbi:DUF1176 domain-containing protein [Aquibium oceanicum]|uniref:DUF1176 domain-containing protein n=1 Tax=Aquibium oceanicum TaxID=1670800 RepID=A0A1L3SST7_9HYPH|nr:DUF1176 domain-containing protein [Aquibium oceanicum]APH72372.1 DUF1176 domain-containing protein [Aquibium oceanicum]
MSIRSLALLALGASILHAPAALGQDLPYQDDRSDAEALIESYYNAVNRREFARAWDYYGEKKPAADFDAFSDGYVETERVELVTGPVGEEGAAGSRFFNVPIAIRATNTDGSEQVFSGCYTARLASPQIQGVPFQPLHISDWSFSKAQEPLEDAVPAQCGDAPVPSEQKVLLRRAKELFETAYSDICGWGAGGDASQKEPEVHTISYHATYDGPEEPARQAHLFRFFCGMGAYNESHVYYISTELDGLRQLQFAEPDLQIRRENDDDSESPVEDVRIVGYTVEDQLVNSFYSPEEHTISSHSKWRGVGDASSSGLWLFRDGSFTLVRYEVDATYDGEINPQTVLDYYTAP